MTRTDWRRRHLETLAEPYHMGGSGQGVDQGKNAAYYRVLIDTLCARIDEHDAGKPPPRREAR